MCRVRRRTCKGAGAACIGVWGGAKGKGKAVQGKLRGAGERGSGQNALLGIVDRIDVDRHKDVVIAPEVAVDSAALLRLGREVCASARAKRTR